MDSPKSAVTRTPACARPVGVDLFAGAGGLSLGFEQAGFDVAAAVEIDPIHCATHKFNFPLCRTICASVADLNGEQIRQRGGLGKVDIDVVFGGAPCQGFSLIGKRALADPRNQLVFHYVRLVRELQPKYAVFENVKGLTLGKQAQFLAELIASLEAAGYGVLKPYRVLNAADFGVPQDRQRLFLIATRTGLGPPGYPLAQLRRTTVQDAISDLPDADDFQELLTNDEVPVRWLTRRHYAQQMRGTRTDLTDFAHPRHFDLHRLTSSARTEHTALSALRFSATAPGQTEPVSRFRRLPALGLCNTLRAGTDSARGAFTSPRPIHPIKPRVITVREAARLHSYPDWFRFHATKWHGFRQIGNSVPPLLARAVGAKLMQALGVQPTRPLTPLALGMPTLLNCDMSQAARYFEVPRNVIAQRVRKPLVEADLFDAEEALHAV